MSMQEYNDCIINWGEDLQQNFNISFGDPKCSCYNGAHQGLLVGEITIENKPAEFHKLTRKARRYVTEDQTAVYGLENAEL